jgi:ribosomal RNA-processing protein 12
MNRYCITDEDIFKAIERSEERSQGKNDKRKANEIETTVIASTISTLSASMQAVAFAKSIPSLLSILSSLIARLRVRTPSSKLLASDPTAAQILVADLVKYVGGLRVARGFEYRERADNVLGMAIRVMGPAATLELLPLNLIPEYVIVSLRSNEGALISIIRIATRRNTTKDVRFCSLCFRRTL